MKFVDIFTASVLVANFFVIAMQIYSTLVFVGYINP